MSQKVCGGVDARKHEVAIPSKGTETASTPYRPYYLLACCCHAQDLKAMSRLARYRPNSPLRRLAVLQ